MHKGCFYQIIGLKDFVLLSIHPKTVFIKENMTSSKEHVSNGTLTRQGNKGEVNRFDNAIEILLLLLVHLCVIYKLHNIDIYLFYRNILKDNEVNYKRLELNDVCITVIERIDNITFLFSFSQYSSPYF